MWPDNLVCLVIFNLSYLVVSSLYLLEGLFIIRLCRLSASVLARSYLVLFGFGYLSDVLLRAYRNIDCNTFFADFVQIVAKLLILKKRNMQIMCRLCADKTYVLVVFFMPGLKYNKNNDLAFKSRTK